MTNTTNQKDSSAKAMADTVQRLQGEPAARMAKLSQDSSATSIDLDKLEALANAGAPVALRAETLRDLIDLARRAKPAPQAATPLPGGQDERVDTRHDNLRDNIGQAIADYAAEHTNHGGNVGIDWCSAHDIDPLADKIVALIVAQQAAPEAPAQQAGACNLKSFAGHGLCSTCEKVGRCLGPYSVATTASASGEKCGTCAGTHWIDDPHDIEHGQIRCPECADRAPAPSREAAPLDEIRSAASDLLKYLDDHDWGGIPEGATADRLRTAVAKQGAAQKLASKEGGRA